MRIKPTNEKAKKLLFDKHEDAEVGEWRRRGYRLRVTYRESEEEMDDRIAVCRAEQRRMVWNRTSMPGQLVLSEPTTPRNYAVFLFFIF